MMTQICKFAYEISIIAKETTEVSWLAKKVVSYLEKVSLL